MGPDDSPAHEKASLDHAVVLQLDFLREPSGLRSAQERLEEAVGLTAAIDLTISDAQIVPLQEMRPATLMGTGKVDEIRDQLDAVEPRPGLVIVNASLSPVQHRNLERAWHAKVLDRTALILEIFGARAKTKEGRLQVSLAHLNYQRSRLVRSWTHLERQRGGAGFLGGPGERQIEADRRILASKIDKLKAQIDQVRRTRTLQRAKRKKAPHPVIALVGYTNAGKSTLFNRMTGAGVMAEDLLFATLDPTMRAVDLPGVGRVILSDTVGFISDLPTDLVAAFRATLEEVLEADIILHVRDIAHLESDAQSEDVISVLGTIGIDEESTDAQVIEVWNKIDLLNEEDRNTALTVTAERSLTTEGSLEDPVLVAVSAVDGLNIHTLFEAIDERLTRDFDNFTVLVSPEDGAAEAWLHQNGDIGGIEPADQEGVRVISVRLSEKGAGQFQSKFGLKLAEADVDDSLNHQSSVA
ncbi:MAG: GTPase HflX [Pseudomonadota bacterium]